MIKIIECPRDAIQGIEEFVPTSKKIEYINHLLKVGFHTIDFGSFVSPTVIPQMRDTKEVLDGLELEGSSSKLLSIVANFRGAETACTYSQINYVGFPLSVSEEFQMRNSNKNIESSLDILSDIQDLCIKNNKQLVVYLSMAFGNPYQEVYHEDIVAKLTMKLKDLDVNIISLSDTIGVSNPENITRIFSLLVPEYNNIEFGAHFHTHPDLWEEKIESAYSSGCRRFDSAIKGYGGCPMAQDDLIGNMPTEKLISFFDKEKIDLGLDKTYFNEVVEKIKIYF